MTILAETIRPLVVSNKASGNYASHAAHWDAFRTDNARILEFDRETDLPAVIQDAVQAGFNTVIAAGGDGTVNAVVNALMTIDSASRPGMAILPLGTANDFAGTLCIPDDIDEAIELIGHSRCLPVDVIRIRADGFEMHYANIAAGGNSVRVTEEITSEMKSQWGAFCYLRGALNVLTDLKSFRINAVLDDEHITEMDTWAVLVANGKTNAGRIVVAPNASPVDGLMDVILIRGGSVVDIIEIVSNAVLGNYLECEQVVYRQVQHLKLDSNPAMRFTVDGEIINKEPVAFDVIPAAINMFVGEDFLHLARVGE